MSQSDSERRLDNQWQPRVPEGGRIVNDGHPSPLPPMQDRTLGGMIAGAAGAVAGWFGGQKYTDVKMYHFDGEVANLVSNDIMNGRRGAGAALDSAGGMVETTPLGGFGAGMGSHSLREKHSYNLAESGKFPFARFVKKIGSWPITLGAAAVTGLAAMVAYFALAPKNKIITDAAELTPDVMRNAARESMERTGVGEHLKQLIAAETPEERKRLSAEWEAKDNAEREQTYGKAYAAQFRQSAKKAGQEASAADMLKELIAADPEKRKEMLAGWEAKMAERKEKSQGETPMPAPGA